MFEFQKQQHNKKKKQKKVRQNIIHIKEKRENIEANDKNEKRAKKSPNYAYECAFVRFSCGAHIDRVNYGTLVSSLLSLSSFFSLI